MTGRAYREKLIYDTMLQSMIQVKSDYEMAPIQSKRECFKQQLRMILEMSEWEMERIG